MTTRVLAIALAGTLALAGGAAARPPLAEPVLENPCVRVTVLTFEPGGSTGAHVGPEPEPGVVLEGELTLDTSAGSRRLRAGMTYWVPGHEPHDMRNESSRPAKLWDAILKPCS